MSASMRRAGELLSERQFRLKGTHPSPSRRTPSARDSTVTTNGLSTRSRSSSVPDEMCSSAAVGRDGQFVPKVEGLVVRLDRGSSNLPGRIGKPRQRGAFVVLRGRAVLAGGNVGTGC